MSIVNEHMCMHACMYVQTLRTYL